MGYGAILGQVPRIDEALAAYDKTIKSAYPIATGNSVTAGDVVDVVNGEVTRSVVAKANVENAYYTGNPVTANVVCRLNDGVSVVFASSSTLALFLIDNQEGKVINVHGLNVSGTKLSITRLNDTKFIVTWYDGNNIQSACGTVNDTTISLGSSQYLVAISDVNSQSLVPLSETSCAVIYGTPARLGVHVCTISGTTITQGTNKIVTTHSTYSVSATLLPDDSSSNKRVCVCFSDANDNNKGKAVIVTINSSNVVTWGSVVAFNDAASYLISCASNGNTVVVSYANDSACYCRVLAVNGTSITAGSQTQFEKTEIKAESSVVCIGGKFVVCGHGQTSGGAVSGSYAIVLNVSGLNITANTAYKFDPASAFYLRACPISDNKLIIAYADNGNSNYGTSTILEVNGNQIAGGFTVNSTQAIALESGEAGQEIEVIFAGTTAADFVAEGQKIPSDGVYGYGPMTGWLNIIPYWAKDAGVRIATGNYVGTGSHGQSNPNSLTFPFVPKLVFIYAVNTSNSTRDQATFVFEAPFYTYLMTSSTSGNAVGNASFGASAQFNGNVMSWYGGNAVQQFNTNGTVYHFVAIG